MYSRPAWLTENPQLSSLSDQCTHFFIHPSPPHPFLHSFIHSPTSSPIHSSIHPSFRPSAHPLIPSFIDSFINPFVRPFLHSFSLLVRSIKPWVGLYLPEARQCPPTDLGPGAALKCPRCNTEDLITSMLFHTFLI